MVSIIHKSYIPYFLLLLLAVPLYFLNIHDLHGWGDDYAQYIKEALNIANGKPYYESTWIYNPYNPVYAPPQYPPGLPLLLAPVVNMFGLSISAMCYFNSFLATCLLLALYSFFRHHAGKIAAICMALMITYSAYMVDTKGQILADMPCMLFFTLYLSLRQNNKFSVIRVLLLVLLASFAIQIRSQAIAIVVAEGGMWLLSTVITTVNNKRIDIKTILNNTSLHVILGVGIANIIFKYVIFPAPSTATSFYQNMIVKSISDGLFSDPYNKYIYLQNSITDFWFSRDASMFSLATRQYISLFITIAALTGLIM